jgi:PAS domain S-box-containing protein
MDQMPELSKQPQHTDGDAPFSPNGKTSPAHDPDAYETHKEIEADHFRHIINQINEHYVVYDRDWRYVFVNDGAAQLLGRPVNELLGQRIWDLFPDAVGNDYYHALHRALEEQRDVVLDFFYPPFQRWFENRIYALSDGVLVLSIDITERKNIEAQLHESQYFLQQLTATVPHVIYVYDLQENRNVYANQLLPEVLGYTPAEIQALGDEFLPTVIHPEDWAATPPHIAQLFELADRQVIEREYRMQHKNGDWRWFHGREMVFSRDPVGHPVQILGSILDVTDRKQAEQALRQTRDNLDLALAATRMGTWDWDVQADRYIWNAGQYEIFGVTPDQFVINVENVWRATHPEDREKLQALATRALATGESYQVEHRIVRPSGEVRWCMGGASVILDPSGTPVRMSGITYDITEQKQAEFDTRFLADLSERIRLSEDSTELLAAVVQLVGSYLRVSCCYVAEVDEVHDRWVISNIYPADAKPPVGNYRLSEYPPEQIQLLRSGQVLISDDALSDPVSAPYYEGYYHPLGARAYVSFPFLRDGQWVAVMVLLNGTPRRWTAREITLLDTVVERLWNAVERLRFIAAQRDEAARLQQLNSASLALLRSKSRDELMSQITTQARTLIGTSMAVINLVPQEGWSAAQTVVSLSEAYAAWENYTAPPTGKGIYRLAYEQRRPLRLTNAELLAHPAWQGFGSDATHHPPLNGLLIAPLLKSDGDCIGLIQLSDKLIGEFSVADEALLQQLAQIAAVALEKQILYEQEQAARAQAEEASRIKDEFLATVSHELRTPLTALLGYAQLLLSRKRDEAYVTRTVEKIVRSAKAQAQITEDLLDVARIVTGKLRIEPQPLDLLLVIRAALETVRPAAEAKTLQIHVDLNPAARTIIGDANRLQQVVWNLLSNAIKFTASGGTIEIRLQPEGRDTCLIVSDTGQGISPTFLPYVFDRFRQAESTSSRSYGGLGLGLAIVRHLVELHGGTVEVASEGVGKGATFTVRLPLALHENNSTTAPSQTLLESFPVELIGLRVLIVDDQPDILELLHEIFVACGSVVQLCTNAREALALVRSWRPDVLVSDIAMTNEDGYWLIKNIRALEAEEGGNLPAAALTAYVRMEDRIRVLAEGYQLYVPKPIDPAELRQAVARLAQLKVDE